MIQNEDFTDLYIINILSKNFLQRDWPRHFEVASGKGWNSECLYNPTATYRCSPFMVFTESNSRYNSLRLGASGIHL